MTCISGSNTVSDGYNQPYTPTTEHVRNSVIFDFDMSEEETVARFDRWLAKVKREAIADWQLAQLAATIEATRGENK